MPIVRRTIEHELLAGDPIVDEHDSGETALA